jgi:hypothetical protein
MEVLVFILIEKYDTDGAAIGRWLIHLLTDVHRHVNLRIRIASQYIVNSNLRETTNGLSHVSHKLLHRVC